MTFKECDSCTAKPGSPPLCSGCLHNREVIRKLTQGLQNVQGQSGRGHWKFIAREALRSVGIKTP